jgi:hypothetical protein
VTAESDEPAAQAQTIVERVLALVRDCRVVLRSLEQPPTSGVIERRGRADSLLHTAERHRAGAYQDDGGRAPGHAPRESAAWADGCRVVRPPGPNV